jgi:hypothetical protein
LERQTAEQHSQVLSAIAAVAVPGATAATGPDDPVPFDIGSTVPDADAAPARQTAIFQTKKTLTIWRQWPGFLWNGDKKPGSGDPEPG